MFKRDKPCHHPVTGPVPRSIRRSLSRLRRRHNLGGRPGIDKCVTIHFKGRFKNTHRLGDTNLSRRNYGHFPFDLVIDDEVFAGHHRDGADHSPYVGILEIDRYKPRPVCLRNRLGRLHGRICRHCVAGHKAGKNSQNAQAEKGSFFCRLGFCFFHRLTFYWI